jgi:glycosyltransferase involved in cell wall biosynthesis
LNRDKVAIELIFVMPKISVIVPIYNMEKLMRKCLDSILAQTFEDYECLLIDDGSKDGSPAICDEYAAKDPRFTVYHKPNGGLSDARNYGIERAQGEYTIFFDPDDWVDEDCLKDMYAKAVETDADMVMCDLYYNDPYRQSYCKQEPTNLDHNDVLKDLIVGKVYGFTVTKLLSRRLYQQYDLQYPIGMYGCEDQYTMCKLLKNDIKIAYLPKAYYHYMHYGNATQSRRYDESTYQQDVKIRDMFVGLLADTPYRQLAYDKKSMAIVARAFYFGNRIYNSQSYKERFASYKYLFEKEDRIGNVFIMFSLKGYYRFARLLFGVLFSIKQGFKKIKIYI